MLMHHPDAEPARVAGRGDAHDLTANADLTCIGGNEAERHLHERGLSSTVLAQECVHRPGAQYKIGPVECCDGAETLSDSR
jgi:hypothetical protein